MSDALQAAADAFDDAFGNADVPIVISPQVASFLLQLVRSVSYTVTADNIHSQAALIAAATDELSR